MLKVRQLTVDVLLKIVADFGGDINSGNAPYDKEETAVPCPYNIIAGRDTALPSPNFGC
ncbi:MULTISPECIES: hypothetical protein [unclassified Microcoleus]|uniref:hypothetical protein n=1 Tax=unclassified Microcoleus TaxID=2642155 RepID=UPI002FD2ED0F